MHNLLLYVQYTHRGWRALKLSQDVKRFSRVLKRFIHSNSFYSLEEYFDFFFNLVCVCVCVCVYIYIYIYIYYVTVFL